MSRFARHRLLIAAALMSAGARGLTTSAAGEGVAALVMGFDDKEKAPREAGLEGIRAEVMAGAGWRGVSGALRGARQARRSREIRNQAALGLRASA